MRHFETVFKIDTVQDRMQTYFTVYTYTAYKQIAYGQERGDGPGREGDRWTITYWSGRKTLNRSYSGADILVHMYVD